MKIILTGLIIVLQIITCTGQNEYEVIESVGQEDWFLNSRYGLVFEAPKILEKVDFEMSEGADMIKNFNIYIYNHCCPVNRNITNFSFSIY